MRRNFGLPSRTSHDFSSAYNGLHILGCWIVWPFFQNMSVDRMTFFPLLECRSFFFVSRYTPWPTNFEFVFDFVWFALLSANFRSKNTAEVPGTSEFSKFELLINVWDFCKFNKSQIVEKYSAIWICRKIEIAENFCRNRKKILQRFRKCRNWNSANVFCKLNLQKVQNVSISEIFAEFF